MNKNIKEAIFIEIPELNPDDPRSVEYKRKLNKNEDIVQEFIELFAIVGLYFISLLLITINFKPYNFFFKTLLFLPLLYFKVITKTIVLLIKIYQNYAPSSVRRKCRFEPSCSNYTLEVIQEKTLLKGIYLSIDRIYRCSFKHDGGFEYPN